MITKNFKFLRRYFNDKQESLAKMLHISQSVISEWEHGKEIPMEMLCKIAYRYNVSIDDLKNKDLSLFYEDVEEINIDTAMKISDSMFPLLTSNIATTNASFNQAYDTTISLLNLDDVNELDKNIEILRKILVLYKRAWNESSTYVALSNSITLILFFYVFYTQRGINIGQELINKEKLSELDIHTAQLRDPRKEQQSNPYEDKQHAFFNKYDDIVYEYIKILKNNKHFNELGDFYLGLCYLIGFTEDILEAYTLSYQVGLYMLIQQCKLENQYAEKFIDSISLS